MSMFRQLLALSAEGHQNYYPKFPWVGGGTGLDEHTILLLHGDEFTDVSDYNHTVEVNSVTIVDEGKFNKAFYVANRQTQNGLHVSLQQPLRTEYTVDFWFKPTDYSATWGAFFTVGTTHVQGIYLQFIPGSDKFDFYIEGEWAQYPNLSTLCPLNQWSHWAVVGTETNTIIYLNGAVLGTFGPHDLNDSELYAFKSIQYGRSVPGYMSEIRVSDIARWTEPFDPPTEQYERPITGGLPSGYTPLSYIASTGTQYINTGIAPAVDLEVDMVASFQGNYDSSWDCILHAGENDMWSGTYGMRLFGDNTTLQVCYSMYGLNGSTSSSYVNPTVTIVPNQVYTIRTTNQTLTLDGVTTVGTPSPIDFTPVNYPMYLFAGNSSGSMWRRSRATIYSLKLTVGGEVVRDFLPALNEEGTPGLFDKVSQSFFTNQGTGTFVYEES